jgi:uncharacterized YccA/Bax inhibitor family protein
MRSGNPALSESTFLDLASGSVVARPGRAMAGAGSVERSGILWLLTVLTAAFAWSQSVDAYGQVSSSAMMYTIGGAVGGLILALVTVFKKEWSPSLRRCMPWWKASSSVRSRPCST